LKSFDMLANPEIAMNHGVDPRHLADEVAGDSHGARRRVGPKCASIRPKLSLGSGAKT
jgi:hypothetical protein